MLSEPSYMNISLKQTDNVFSPVVIIKKKSNDYDKVCR